MPPGVDDGFAQHLESTTDLEDLAAVAQVALDVFGPALGPEPFAVGPGALAAGEDDEVSVGFGLAGADELEANLGRPSGGAQNALVRLVICVVMVFT